LNKFLQAQAIGGGQIQGTITDSTGSAVSGATVEATQSESGLHRTVLSGADGGYNLPSLPVGPYTLKVTATGFSTYDQSGIVIQVGNELRIDVKLQVGVNLPFPFPDAIQEFSVQTSGLSPQYGVHPGAVVNIVTRAGGNSFHGTLFDGLVDFMLGRIQSLYQGNNSALDFRKNYAGLYFQDSIQFSPRFTMNAGLRWATGLPAIETTGRGAQFSLARFTAGTKSVVYPTAPAGVYFYGDPGVPHGYYHGKWNRIEPRFGIVFDPRGQGKKSIRASHSLGFQEPPLYYNSRYASMPPWGDSVTLTPPPGNLTTLYAGYPGGNPYPKPFPPTASNAFFPTSGTYFG
jgi:hypothetical protein